MLMLQRADDCTCVGKLAQSTSASEIAPAAACSSGTLVEVE